MPKLSVQAGSTGFSCNVFVQSSTATDGSGGTAIPFNASGLTAYYIRQRTTATPITLATSTVGNPWVSGGWVEIDSTHAKGGYNFDIPNVVLGTGSPFATVVLEGAASMAPLWLEIELTGWNNQDGTAAGLVALSSTGSLGSVSNVRGTATVILNASTHAGAVIPVVQTASNLTGAVALTTAVASAPTVAQIWALYGTGTVALTTAVAAAPTVAQVTTGVWAAFGTGTVMLGTGTHTNAVIPTVNVVQTATVNNFTANAMARFFDLDSGTYSTSSANSVVVQIAQNAGGAAAPTVAQIATAVWAKFGTGTVALTTAVAAAPDVSQIATKVWEKYGTATVALTTGVSAAQPGDAMALTAGERTSLAAVIGTSSQAESYRAKGAGGSINQMLYELIGHMGEDNIVGTTKSTLKVDQATTAMTFALTVTTDSSGNVNPTAISRAT